MKTELVISGIGVHAPIGHDAASCMHTVRTSMSRLDVVSYPDVTGEYITGGQIYTWTWNLRVNRLQELAERALGRAWKNASANRESKSFGRVAVLIGVPEKQRPGYRFPPDGLDLSGWPSRLGLPRGPVEIVADGACSVQRAVRMAAEILETGDIGACIVGGVDTQLQIPVIRWHEKHYRLKCAYATDGLNPAEAACFLVLEKEADASRRGGAILARIRSTAAAHESAVVTSDQPNTAKGLTEAVRTALGDAGVQPADLAMVWSDLNGESYRAREWAFTEIRVGVTDRTELMHPADCHGDLGAATDANLLALAAMAQATGWSRGKPQLVFAGSEGGIRAATVIGPPAEPAADGLPLQVSVGLPRALAARPVAEPLGPDEVQPADTEDPPRTYFQWQLRQEHLEEITALYYQRRTLLVDPELPWPRVGEPEQRILNHVDAVVSGGPASIWAVASGLLGEEEGACFAGALVLSVLPHARNFEHLERALDQPPAPRVAAVHEALRHARPQGLKDRVVAWLRHPRVEVRAMAIGLLGELRLDEPSRVYAFLNDPQPMLQHRAVEALRRLRDVLSVSDVERLATHADASVAREAALAALCLGSRSVQNTLRQLCRAGASTTVQPRLLLALGGEFRDLDVILRSSQFMTVELVTALGILGYPDAVDTLLAALRGEDDAVKVAAAEALDLITGARLREEAEIRDPDDPGHVDYVERVCTAFPAWSKWWTARRSTYEADRRWRRGRPFELSACVDELSDPRTTYDSRQRAHWELVIHGKQDLPYEPDWFVSRQQSAIAAWKNWLQN